MTRRQVVGSMLAAATARAAASRPNIIFIFADDWGWGDLSCHGHPRIKTPVLDRMAAEGADFHQFTVANPVCSPSRTAVMTGHYPARYSVHEHFATHTQNAERGMPDWLDPKAPMLPRQLKQAGYRTGHFGKWHLTNLDAIPAAPRPEAYGYDESLLWNGPCPCAVGDITEPAFHADEFAAKGTIAAVDGAIRFIQASQRQPFFINLWIHETHTPLGATPVDRKPYADVPEPGQTYYSAVSRADRQIGRIFETLKERKLDGNTLVVFTSDNGPESPSPKAGTATYFSVGSTGGLQGRKRSLLMGGVNVPFLVRWPGRVPAGLVDRTTAISAVDLLPTLCAAAGCKLPAAYAPDGENVLSAWTGKKFGRRKPLYWEWRGTHAGQNWPAWGMRDGRFALVTSADGSRTELYDLVADRAQKVDLSGDHPGVVTKMLADIRRWRQTLPATPSPDCVMK